MSIVFDANTDEIHRTANLPVMNGGPYAVSFWFLIATAPTGGDAYQSIFCLNTNNTTHYEQVGVYYNGSNTRLFVALDNGSYFEQIGSINLSIDTWYHCVLVRSSTTSLVAYLNGAAEATNTNAASTQTPTRMDWGVHPQFASDEFKGRVAAIKIWDAALSAEERTLERYQYQPRVFASLNLWSPCFAGSGERTRDYSGLGRNWTEGGTLTDADGPPIAWGGVSVSGYFAGGAATPTVEQEGFRFRNEDGSEGAATWRQSQDVDDSIARETPFRLRMLTNASGDPVSQQLKLQYRKVGASNWRDVKNA